MIIFKQQEPLSKYIAEQKKQGAQIGFVPTMGALHNGHLSLISQARSGNQLVICSIFINPSQFNNQDDFKYYPVTIEKDIEQLISAGCDILFLPPVEEIYPASWQKKHFELGPIENILEGFYRPGHFQGVCQVVDRFLEIIHPHNLYLGQKDFQQCMVVKKLLELTGRMNQVNLVMAPTVRESDGLAMSSRNLRLTGSQRKQAGFIYQALTRIKKNIESENPEALKQQAKKELEDNGFEVDYVEVARVNDLSPAQKGDAPLVALVAATIGDIRLIDNMPLN